MRRGVDGMRVDALEQLFEVEDLRDEPRSNLPGIPPVSVSQTEHRTKHSVGRFSEAGLHE